ncbi:TPA: GIY-YIG nuclease [Candidatus Nomurabacteria bacterium]|nr:GIY-YIG nuclease [Candidatus Nomurabacteria bacterium]
MKIYYVYILANKRNGTLYIGVTNDLKRRIYEHKEKLIDGFTKTYDVNILVWYESTELIESALTKEKQLKKWNRKWKIKIIEENNPEWIDLYRSL